MKLKKLLILPVLMLVLVGCAKTKTVDLKTILNDEIDERIIVNDKKGYYVTITFTSNNGSLDLIEKKDDCKFIKSMKELKEIFVSDTEALEIFKEDIFDNYYIGTAYRVDEIKQNIKVLYKGLVIDGENQVSITKMYNGKVEESEETVTCFDLYLIPKTNLKKDSPIFEQTLAYTYLFNTVLSYKK